jgi:hypothetical protein
MTEKGTARSGPAIVAGKPHGTIIQTSRVDVQTGLLIACIKCLPSANRYLSNNPLVRYRDPQLLQVFEAFTREVIRKTRKPHEFAEFLKDHPNEFARHRMPSSLFDSPAGGLLLCLSSRLSEVLRSEPAA